MATATKKLPVWPAYKLMSIQSGSFLCRRAIRYTFTKRLFTVIFALVFLGYLGRITPPSGTGEAFCFGAAPIPAAMGDYFNQQGAFHHS